MTYPPETLATLLEEDPFGQPLLLARRYCTSHNSVRQIYHLARFEQRTMVDPLRSALIVEWGGGYGALAKMVARWAPSSTYVLIDTPIFLALQWLYLAVVLGEDRVVVHSSPSDPLVPGKLNLVPIGLVGDLVLQTDLFISLFALSESSVQAQRQVAELCWFNAKNMLIGFRNEAPRYLVWVAKSSLPATR